MDDRSSDGGHAGLVRFGVFEVDTRTGELRKRGVRQKLQGKPFQVLVALLEHPGVIVTREALQRKLWPSDVFVDFESGLNTAANRLRVTLGDSADSPRYIETLPRHGYRFIAPVEVIDQPVARPTELPTELLASPVTRVSVPRFSPSAITAAVSVLIAATTIVTALAVRRSGSHRSFCCCWF
jgi:DNA-binding winged helix-turn-helix (wHTH) protein